MIISSTKGTHSTRGHPRGCNLKESPIYHTQTFPKSFIWLSNESAINFRLCRAHLENKSATRFRGEGLATIFQPSEVEKKSSWSLKDTEADNRFTGWLTWGRIKETYNPSHKQSCRISPSLPISSKSLSEGSSRSCHSNSEPFALMCW